MRRRMLLAALAGLLTLLLAAETAQAQISFGIGYGGGGYYGGRGWYGPGFGYGRGYYGPAYGYGWGYPTYGYGYYPYRRGIGINLGFRPSYYYDYGYDYSPGYYARTPVILSRPRLPSPPSLPIMQAGYSVSTPSYTTEAGSTTYQSFYAPSTNQAMIRVTVPSPAAKVWFEGSETRQTGTERLFVSPRLEAGNAYTYTVKATWTENGREVTREKEIRVRPGQETTVAFDDRPAPSPGDTDAPKRDVPPTPTPGDAPKKDFPPPPAPGTEKKDVPPPPE